MSKSAIMKHSDFPIISLFGPLTDNFTIFFHSDLKIRLKFFFQKACFKKFSNIAFFKVQNVNFKPMPFIGPGNFFLTLSRFFLKVTCHFITLQKFFQGCVKTLHDLELIKADAHIFEITWRRYNSTADISADATADATTDATADSTADGTGNCSIHFYKNGILSVFPGNTDRQTAVLKWLIKG